MKLTSHLVAHRGQHRTSWRHFCKVPTAYLKFPKLRKSHKKQLLHIRTVIKREGKDDYWLNIGVCFAHEDKDGFNLLLQAMPLDGKIVLWTCPGFVER